MSLASKAEILSGLHWAHVDSTPKPRPDFAKGMVAVAAKSRRPYTAVTRWVGAPLPSHTGTRSVTILISAGSPIRPRLASPCVRVVYGRRPCPQTAFFTSVAKAREWVRVKYGLE